MQFPVSWNFLQRRSSGPPLRRLCFAAALGAASGILPLETARGTTAPPALASLHESTRRVTVCCYAPSLSRDMQARHTAFAVPSRLQACCAWLYCMVDELATLGLLGQSDHLAMLLTSLDSAVSVEIMLSLSSLSMLLVTKFAEVSTLISSELS